MGKLIAFKDNKFECVRVTGNQDQFHELKRFCGDDITITYESCSVDDYWCIQLDDCLKEKKVVVPNYDYIVKLPMGSTVINTEDFNDYFTDYISKDIGVQDHYDYSSNNIEGD